MYPSVSSAAVLRIEEISRIDLSDKIRCRFLLADSHNLSTRPSFPRLTSIVALHLCLTVFVMEAQVKFKSNPSNEVPVVMTIAGSDASGGAGIQVWAK